MRQKLAVGLVILISILIVGMSAFFAYYQAYLR